LIFDFCKQKRKLLKKILFLIIVAGMAMIISCSKGSPSTPPPPKPTLNVSVSPETAWYSGISTISWTSTNTDSVRVNGVKVNSYFFVTPSLTAAATYTITAFGRGDSVTNTVHVSVWSQKTTLISNYGNWKNIYIVSYKQADSLHPDLYNYFPIDSVNCKSFNYLTNTTFYLGLSNFKGQVIQGCGNAVVIDNFLWNWQNNETQIYYGIGPSLNWNVDTLNSSLLRISKDRPDSTFPNIIVHYVQRFVHG
jgi:hypothetical protein